MQACIIAPSLPCVLCTEQLIDDPGMFIPPNLADVVAFSNHGLHGCEVQVISPLSSQSKHKRRSRCTPLLDLVPLQTWARPSNRFCLVSDC